MTHHLTLLDGSPRVLARGAMVSDGRKRIACTVPPEGVSRPVPRRPSVRDSQRPSGPAGAGREIPWPRPAQHPDHLGRRHRHQQPELLQRRPDGLPHAEHRPHRRRGRPVHRLLRRAELHRRAGRVHHRPEPLPHRADQGRHAGCRHRPAGRGPDHRHGAQGASATRTGQFGKNHFGDRDEFLPTAHGFDEFFGNLYHLNAEEEPELDDYPTEEDFPDFRKNFGPRGVIHSWANERRHPAHRGHRAAHQGADEDHRRRGRARGAAVHDRRQGRPTRRSSCGSTPRTCTSAPTSRTAAAARPAGGSRSTTTRCATTTSWSASVLDFLDEQGLAEDTIVMYSTDNGPHMNTWPDAGMTPFRNEKNSNWEGAYRVPAMVRWPGQIPAGRGAQRHRQPQRLVRHAARRGRRHRRRRPAQGGRRPGRHDVQGAPRRAQPARLHHRRGRREPAQALLLRLRRRRPDRAALRQLEVRLPRAARDRARSTSGPSPTPSCGSRRSST